MPNIIIIIIAWMEQILFSFQSLCDFCRSKLAQNWSKRPPNRNPFEWFLVGSSLDSATKYESKLPFARALLYYIYFIINHSINYMHAPFAPFSSSDAADALWMPYYHICSCTMFCYSVLPCINSYQRNVIFHIHITYVWAEQVRRFYHHHGIISWWIK